MPTTRDLEPSDTTLVERARAGEREAFAALYRRHHLAVYRFARSMSGSIEFAEDVVQEVFLLLMKELHRYETSRASFPTYLFGIARNLARSRLRRERRFIALDASDAHVPLAPDDHAAAFATAQSLARVRAAILSLPVRYREVVVLCDVHALEYAEVATVLHVPLGTVRSRLHRARHLLLERVRRREERPAAVSGAAVRSAI